MILYVIIVLTVQSVHLELSVDYISLALSNLSNDIDGVVQLLEKNDFYYKIK